MSLTTHRWRPTPVLLILLVLPILLYCLDGLAIIKRHDRTDTHYRVDAADFPQVFHLHERFGNKVCVATLIGRRWAITAAHCTTETPIAATLAQGKTYPLTVAEQPNAVTDVKLHPKYNSKTAERVGGVDLALLRLEEGVSVTPVPLYRHADELGQVVTLLGWGYTGNGTRGVLRNDGHLRQARNRIVRALHWLELSFNDPRSDRERSEDLEGVPALGDSGGPALVRRRGSLSLIGVARGELTEAGDDHTQGLYGSTSMYERIILHIDWIGEYVPGVRYD